MALMFPRLARNFAKNGYYPTDEATLERTLGALASGDGSMCILDPCAGEGVAIAEAPRPSGLSWPAPMPSSSTRSGPPTPGCWSITASTVT